LKLILLKLKLCTPEQLSVLLSSMAVPLVEAVPLLFKNKVTFLHKAVGATLSIIDMVLETLAKVLPQASVAVHVSTAEPLQLLELLTTIVEGFEVPLIKQPPVRPLL
jgi:hypothetical protein